MLVALALVALMSVAMLEAYRFSQRALAQTTQVDAAVHDVAATQRVLRRILEQTYPFETPGEAAKMQRGLSGRADGFSVSAPAPARSGGVGLYRYGLARNSNGDLEISWMTDRNGGDGRDS